MSIFAHGTPGELRGFKWIKRVVEAVARSPGYNNTSPRHKVLQLQLQLQLQGGQHSKFFAIPSRVARLAG